MKSETLHATGEDGKPYIVVETTPMILESGLEGIPSYRLDTGEPLKPTTKPNGFTVANSDVKIALLRED